MQHIGVQIQDKDGKTTQESSINFAEVMWVLYDVPDYESKYPLLASIDPYADTIFNALQGSQLVDELKQLGQKGNKAIISDSISLLEKVAQFQYIEFHGD
ncbi:MAG: hypothetical protein COU06_00645 [Candidatus Harrisonbacteria bacterium CG10_big_fil_rev_8_21_14_0_10_38_8]|uniref:Uncharacterized protein n=1 Tax=Candidatus Harrisonbacteria bacterium CG10_big_fil_rev_8_21_14_0_10_38_8 TaxID=1974582 RepID=A0A2M6WKJ5_9BACT|nr:MAG: hypothetical protein COU06_00645 [Candidatus Harrisonbacteria bacterium CG10_big_fil_rev_8_21_14_0_10_38_8]